MSWTRGSRFHVKRRRVLALLTLVAGTLALACTQTDQADGWSSPQVVTLGERDLVIHATGNDAVLALDAESGEILWEFPDPDSDGRFPGLIAEIDDEVNAQSFYADPVVLSPEELAVATYRDGRVYAIRIDGTSARILLAADSDVVAGLNVDRDGVLYVATTTEGVFAIDPQRPLPPDEPLVSAEQPGLLWRFNAFANQIWGSPTLTETETHGQLLLVPALNGTIHALRTDVDPGGAREVWRFEAGSGVASDAVVADGLLYIGGFDRQLYAINVESGEEVWRHDCDAWFWSEVLVDGGTIYAGDLGGRVWALDARTGSPVWDQPYESGDDIRAQPALTPDGETVIVVNRDGVVHAIDRTSGAEVWVSPLDLPDLFYANPLVRGDQIFVANEEGELFIERVNEDAVERFFPPATE